MSNPEEFDDFFEVTAGEESAGQRVDKFLADAIPDMSRSRLKALILAGDVSLNGVPCMDPSKKLKAGDGLAVNVPPPIESDPAAENIPLSIVYEDDDLLVIDKPAGLVVHPGAGNWTGTLVNALLYHCGDSLSGIGGVKRPGIVHRLDKDTSGLMLAAKNDRTHHGLTAQLSDRSLSRKYAALCWYVPNLIKGTIEAPIARHGSNRLKMAVPPRGGKPAATHYEVRERFGTAASLVECTLESGRTHQVRVHMNYLKHPLIGDPLYGLQPTAARAALKKGGYEEGAADFILSFPRQALHAWKISFIHPITKQAMAFESPLPDDLKKLISHLKQ